MFEYTINGGYIALGIMSTNPQVTFQTDFFKPMTDEDEETNPGRYGKELAQWLMQNLEHRGVSVESIIPEDFGWVVTLSRKPFLLWIGCGNIDGSTNEWTIFPVAEISVFQRLFKRANPSLEIEKLKVILSELVPSIPNATNIIWA